MNASDPIEVALDKLNVLGAPLLLHSSMRSLGDRRHDAADVIVNTCIRTSTTLVVPSWTESYFEIDPPPRVDTQRLREEVSAVGRPALTFSAPTKPAEIYHPDSCRIDDDMGRLPHSIIDRPDRVRGPHPLNSFAAVGPSADGIVLGQTYADVYAPIVQLASLGGHILLIGVGLNRMTAFHLAEQYAGRRLCTRWALDPAGHPRAVLTGGCSEGFPHLWPAVRSLASTLIINGSQWLSFPAHDVIQAVTHAISTRAIDTACSTTCHRCADSAASGS